MPKIQVAKAFTFTDKNGKAERFEIGQHTVSNDVANHPYVGFHLAPVDPADAARADKKAAAEKADADKKAAAELAEAQRIAAAQTAQVGK